MLKRLTFAAMILGIVMAFGSSAVADDSPSGDELKLRQFDNQETKTNMADRIGYGAPVGLQREAGEPYGPVFVDHTGQPQTSSPDTAICPWYQFYIDDAGTSSYWGWTRPGGDTRELAVRFDIPAGHAAEVYAAYAWIIENDPGAELTVTIYGDMGGIPDDADIIYSEAFPMATDMGGGYAGFEFTGGPILLEGYEAYHLGFLSTGAGGEVIRFISDDGGEAPAGTAMMQHRSSYRSSGLWVSTFDLWGETFDPMFDFGSESCIYYSSCYFDSPAMQYYFAIPDDIGASEGYWTGWGNRFVAGNDSLVSLEVVFYNRADGAQVYTGTNETNAVLVQIWDDDGSGNPDYAAGPLATRQIGPGVSAMFPTTNEVRANGWAEFHTIDFTADELMMRGPWHATCNLTSADPADGQVNILIADFDPNGSVAYNADAVWEQTGTNVSWLDWWENEASFYIGATLCRNEFAECQNQILHAGDFAGGFTIADGSNLAFMAQKVRGNPVNAVDKIRVMIHDEVPYGGDPGDNGNPGINVIIWSDDGGLPGSILYSIPVTDPVYYPGWNEVVIPGFMVLSDFWVGYEGIFPDPANDYFYASLDMGTDLPINGAGYTYYRPWGEWISMDLFGYGTINWQLEVEFCSIPVEEWNCFPGTASDWPTINGNFARTGHSSEPIGDAWCDLTLDGQWTHSQWGIVFCGPVIWNDLVIQCFGGTAGSGYYFFDIDDIAAGPIDEITSATYPNSIATQVRCTPTVAEVGGTPMLFAAGGTAWSVSAYDLTTVPGVTQVWSADATNGWLGHDIGGGIRYGNFIVLDDVVYFGDDGGLIHAANAADGTPFSGWAESYQLIGLPLSSGATDGTNLFYSAFTAGVEGDVVAIKATTGNLSWSFAATSGLQAAVLWPTLYVAGSESFPGAPVVDGGEVYVNSTIAGAVDLSPGNMYGIFYRINSATGAMLSAAPGNETQTVHPLVDANNVLVPTFYEGSYNCPTSDFGGSLLAYGRATGTLTWASSPEVSGCFFDWLSWEGAMTCEPSGVDDIAIFFSDGTTSSKAYLSFFNASNGEELFHRRIDHGVGATRGSAVAVGADSEGDVHVVAADQFGTIYNFTKGDDRPRLEVLAWVGNQAVPFNTSSDTLVTFPNIYTNTGCTDLIVTLEASDTDNGVTIGSPQYGSVRKDFQDRAATMADRLAGNYSKFPAIYVDETVEVDPQTVPSLRDLAVRSTTNRAAMATPAFLIEHGGPGDVFDPPGGGIVTAPGDSSGVSVYVDGPLINRGPQSFYVQFAEHNDPDYYLNDNSLVPQLQLTLVGGCLWDTTYLNFGAGGANFQVVFNTLQQGHTLYMDTDPPDGGNLNVDGYFNGNFAGFFCYAITQRRLAFASTNWRGGGDENVWIGIQADPNYIDDECKPAIATGVSLGMATTDGFTYEPLTGNMVYKSYIDSVQNFDDGFGAWDYTLYETAPFDNDSTIGIAGNGRCFGVVDAPPGFELLNNLFVEIMDLWERNGNEVPDWKFGGFFDNDMVVDWPGDFDTTYFDYSVSAGWATTNELAAGQSGYIKLPWGPGYDPMINAFPMERAQSANNDADGNNWDSVYYYMSLPPNTLYGHDQSTADDQDAFYTYNWHDFEANGQHSFAVASFYFTDAVTNSASSEEFIAPASRLVNKWVGFGRGDVDNDDAVTLGDIIALAEYVHFEGPGPIPFLHLGDVNADGETNNDDVLGLKAWYFNEPGAEAPAGEWAM